MKLELLQLDEVMWKTVQANQYEVSRYLFDVLGVNPSARVHSRDTTPLQEAHARGLTDLIATFHKNRPPDSRFAQNEDIRRTLDVSSCCCNYDFKDRTTVNFRIAGKTMNCI